MMRTGLRRAKLMLLMIEPSQPHAASPDCN
ncbi:hypothetical protein JOE25_001921 [Serratia sp. PL17]|nr:hypothetical protein [Serratia sp. PL17]